MEKKTRWEKEVDRKKQDDAISTDQSRPPKP
jgi:hypothetical protein